MTKVNLMMWNILYGFHSMQHKGFEQYRQDMAVNLVKDLDPDVLVLNEACFATPRFGKHMPYAQIFGYEHAAISGQHWEWQVVILSKLPLKWSTISIHDRFAVRAIVDGGVMVDTYHTHPFWTDRMKSEAYEILAKTRIDPYVLTGDFNAVPHKSPFGDDSLVHENLRRLGLRNVDDITEQSPSFPTQMLKVDTRNPVCRLDHMLTSGVTTSEFRVVYDKRADVASDHYPLYAELEY